jgi:hypothetical protein
MAVLEELVLLSVPISYVVPVVLTKISTYPLAANPVCAGPGKFVVPIITVVAPLGAIESLLNVTGISVCVAGTVVTKDEVEMIVLPFGAILSTGTGMVVTTDEADGPLAAVFTPKILGDALDSFQHAQFVRMNILTQHWRWRKADQ